jgi:hypothetical protein
MLKLLVDFVKHEIVKMLTALPRAALLFKMINVSPNGH